MEVTPVTSSSAAPRSDSGPAGRRPEPPAARREQPQGQPNADQVSLSPLAQAAAHAVIEAGSEEAELQLSPRTLRQLAGAERRPQPAGQDGDHAG